MQHVARIAPYWLILGNHDLNLKNKGRLDAISPIVNALQGSTDHPLELLNGPLWNLRGFPEFAFWNYDIRNDEHEFGVDPSKINIGLYHGSISGCVTDLGFTMEEGERDVTDFSAMDFVLMGDIHRRQSFRDGRMQYPGSLIQQNYGEGREKGFLLWNIRGKDGFDTTFHSVTAPRRFYTIHVGEDLVIPPVEIPHDSRIRVILDSDPPPSQKIELEQRIRRDFFPAEIICAPAERSSSPIRVEDIGLKRSDLMRDYLRERDLPEDRIEEIIRLSEAILAEEEESDVGLTWKLRSIEWDGVFNYGEGNRIDVERLKGLVGIFAPNSSGKSSIFDILLQALYDKISKDVPKNIDLINDNLEVARIGVKFSAGGADYDLERKIERIKYGQRKADVKQWGRTSLDLSQGDLSLNGTTRPETEKVVQALVGSFEDFSLTTMVSQNPIFGIPGGGDIINCKETDRRKILFRFLDLDIYDHLASRAKEELKAIRVGSSLSRGTLVDQVNASTDGICRCESEIVDLGRQLEGHRAALVVIREGLSRGGSHIPPLDALSVIELQLSVLEREDAEDTISLQRMQHSLGELRRDPPPVHQATLNDIAELIQRARTKKEGTSARWTTAEAAVESGRRSLRVLEKVPCEGKFPTCQFISDAVKFSEAREELEAALHAIGLELDTDKAEISRLTQVRLSTEKYLNWEKSVRDLELRIAKIETALAKRAPELDRFREERDRVKRELSASSAEEVARLRDEAARLIDSVSGLEAKISGLNREIGGHEASRVAAEAAIAAHDEKTKSAEIYEQILEMAGKNGLPYRILSRVLPILNEEISQVLAGVARFNVFFEDDSEQQAVALRIRYGDYKSRPLSLGGGAEKFIAALAIRVALLTVSSLPKTDLLIIDEGFGKLDPENLDAVQRMFEKLRDKFETVFIISHVDSMRDIVDHSIDIVSRDGYAHVTAP